MSESKPMMGDLFSSDEILVDWRDLQFSHPERKFALPHLSVALGRLNMLFKDWD